MILKNERSIILGKKSLNKTESIHLLSMIRSSKIVLCLVFLSAFAKAQSVKDTGNVKYVQDVRVVEMMNKKTQINEKKDGKIAGFRVQIHFGSDSDVAKNIKSKFLQKFDSVAAYMRYDQPNFKIRVGDYRSRLDAYRFYKMISADFPGSFIVEDEVELKELVK